MLLRGLRRTTHPPGAAARARSRTIRRPRCRRGVAVRHARRPPRHGPGLRPPRPEPSVWGRQHPRCARARGDRGDRVVAREVRRAAVRGGALPRQLRRQPALDIGYLRAIRRGARQRRRCGLGQRRQRRGAGRHAAGLRARHPLWSADHRRLALHLPPPMRAAHHHRPRHPRLPLRPPALRRLRRRIQDQEKLLEGCLGRREKLPRVGARAHLRLLLRRRADHGERGGRLLPETVLPSDGGGGRRGGLLRRDERGGAAGGRGGVGRGGEAVRDAREAVAALGRADRRGGTVRAGRQNRRRGGAVTGRHHRGDGGVRSVRAGRVRAHLRHRPFRLQEVAGRGVRDDGERRRGGRDRDEPAFLQRFEVHDRGGHLPHRRRQPRVHAPPRPCPLPAPRGHALRRNRRRRCLRRLRRRLLKRRRRLHAPEMRRNIGNCKRFICIARQKKKGASVKYVASISAIPMVCSRLVWFQGSTESVPAASHAHIDCSSVGKE